MLPKRHGIEGLEEAPIQVVHLFSRSERCLAQTPFLVVSRFWVGQHNARIGFRKLRRFEEVKKPKFPENSRPDLTPVSDSTRNQQRRRSEIATTPNFTEGVQPMG